MEAKSYDSLVEVYRGSLWEAELMKGLLESAGVSAMLGKPTGLASKPPQAIP